MIKETFYGYTSKANAEGTNHIIMVDYDDKTLQEIKNIWAKLIGSYNLPFVLIIKSSNKPKHYWVVSPVCLSYGKYLRLLFDAGADPLFAKYFFQHKRNTIRITSKNGFKPKLVCVLKRLFLFNSFSKPHYKLFKTLYGFKLTKKEKNEICLYEQKPDYIEFNKYELIDGEGRAKSNEFKSLRKTLKSLGE